jgi:signal peptidase I
MRTVNYPDQITPGHEPSSDLIQDSPLQGEPLQAPFADGVDQVAETLSEAEDSKPTLRSILSEIIETIVLAAVIWLAVNFTTARYVVEGQSMQPNLHTGQFLIVSKLSYMEVGNLFTIGSPQRGDVIVFDYPNNPTDDYVKRIIGLPGETVTINERGEVIIDGVLLDEPYLDTRVPYRKEAGTWIVPAGKYFVMGDNRNSSSDSRSWDALDGDYIVGKAWFSYWPLEDLGLIPHYEYNTP